MFGRHSCRSWRPRNDTPHDQNHLPGKCRRCWQLCKRPAQHDGIRCDTCEYDLAQHPDSRVRMALVREGTASISTLSLMTNDADASVADMAKTATYRLKHSVRRPLRAPTKVTNPVVGADPVPAVEPDSWLSEFAPTTDSEHLRRERDVRHG